METLLLPVLSGVLPPEMVVWIKANILNPHSTFQIYKRHALVHAQRGLEAVYPIIQPLVDRFLANEGLVGFAALLTLLVAVFLVVSWVHRVVMWWTRLAMRAVFWMAVFGLLAYGWERGPMECFRDIVVAGGKFVGFLAAMKEVWADEYQKYDSQQQMAGGRGRSSGR